VSPSEVAAVLNRLLAADRKAMAALLHGVPCNHALAYDPDVVVTGNLETSAPFEVSALGLINGLMGFGTTRGVTAVYKRTDNNSPWELVLFRGED